MPSAVRDYWNHVFVSYAHIDNYHFTGISKGWIDCLHERLEIRLAQLLGCAPVIWRDPKLAGNEVFGDSIVIELGRTAILVAVLSPRYIKSSSCLSEVNGFLNAAGAAVRVGDRHRVFKIIKSHVPLEDHPPEVRNLLGYKFYEEDQASGRVREFDYEIGPKGEKDIRYWSRFEDLVWDIFQTIQRLEGGAKESSAPPAGETVYLAESTSDLAAERDKIKRELEQFGHTVLPDQALPLNRPAFVECVRDYLARSRISVHLVGAYYGLIPEMELERSIVRLQHDLALEREDGHPFSRLIWTPPDLQPQDERQRAFLLNLQNDFHSRNGSEFLQVKLEDLKTIIQAKLIPKPKTAPMVSPDNGPARIYVICEAQDLDSTADLRDYLFREGFEVMSPLADATESEAIEDHKENLLVADAVLIVQGLASEAWRRMKLRELIKLPGYGRTIPLASKAVLLTAPATAAKDAFKTHEALVLRSYGMFECAVLDQFLAEIRRAKATAL
jgi:hypothetical protein